MRKQPKRRRREPWGTLGERILRRYSWAHHALMWFVWNRPKNEIIGVYRTRDEARTLARVTA